MHSVSLIVLLVMFLAAVYYRNEGFALVSALAFCGSLFARCWARLSVWRIHVELSLDARRAFPGDEIALKVKVVNGKPVPMPWMDTTVDVPADFLPDNGSREGGENGQTLTYTTSLLWYTAVAHIFRLSCAKRGYYPLGPVRVTSGDPFGLYVRTLSIPVTEHVVVYPKFLPMDPIEIPSVSPVGESVTQRRVSEDPCRLLGVREYLPQDGFKRIHWKATARRQRLQSKIFDSTTSLRTAVFLDVRDYSVGGRSEEFETAVSACATLASRIIESGGQVGLYMNSCKADSGQAVSVHPGGNRGHLPVILENLAKATLTPSGRFLPFLQQELRGLRWGTTLMVIVHSASEELRARLADLKEDGFRIVVIRTGDGEEGRLPDGIPCVSLDSFVRPTGQAAEAEPSRVNNS